MSFKERKQLIGKSEALWNEWLKKNPPPTNGAQVTEWIKRWDESPEGKQAAEIRAQCREELKRFYDTHINK